MREYISASEYEEVIKYKKVLQNSHKNLSDSILNLALEYKSGADKAFSKFNNETAEALSNDLIYIDNFNFEYLPFDSQIEIALSDLEKDTSIKEDLVAKAEVFLDELRIKALNAYKEGTFRKEDYLPNTIK